MEVEQFNLKIALSLIPRMNDDVDCTKQLIESIEYYSSILSNVECKKKIINLVLKNRLSQQAKLKLASSYNSTEELIEDMRKLLLPKKSSVALQNKLQHSRQGDKSISDFGKEISEIFVDLTISQANGNSSNYNVLRPLNENMAIKRFADGLRDRRLSTIIAARHFSSLTDAIQAAQDEETCATEAEPEIMGMYQQPYYSARRGQRGFHTRQRNFRSRGSAQYGQSQQRVQQSQVPCHTYYRNSYTNNQAFRSRGRQNGNRSRGTRLHNNTDVIATGTELSTDHEAAPSVPDPNTESLNHFFRD